MWTPAQDAATTNTVHTLVGRPTDIGTLAVIPISGIPVIAIVIGDSDRSWWVEPLNALDRRSPPAWRKDP